MVCGQFLGGSGRLGRGYLLSGLGLGRSGLAHRGGLDRLLGLGRVRDGFLRGGVDALRGAGALGAVGLGRLRGAVSVLCLRGSHLPARRPERLFLLALELFLRHAMLALELEMLPDGIVENAHRAEAYRGMEDASGSGRCVADSTRFLPPRFAA